LSEQIITAHEHSLRQAISRPYSQLTQPANRQAEIRLEIYRYQKPKCKRVFHWNWT